MQALKTETRRERRERLYGPATGGPNKPVCPARPEPAFKPAPECWDVVTAMKLWNCGLFGDWREFDYWLIIETLGRPSLPYRN
jgi:hypothetical protein